MRFGSIMQMQYSEKYPQYDVHVRAWRKATCPGKCWRCPQAIMRIPLLNFATQIHPVLGPGVQSKFISVCPQKRVPVSIYTTTDWGVDGGCQNGGVSGGDDLVSRDAKAPKWI